MSDFLSAEERANLENDLDMVFDTMTNGRSICVVKEPTKTVIELPPTNNNLFGFGEQQAEPIYTYEPVTGWFPALIMYPKQTNYAPLNPEINARIFANRIMVKVKENCKDFIVSGKTQHILGDGKTFLIDGDAERQMFLSTSYYLIPLKQTL